MAQRRSTALENERSAAEVLQEHQELFKEGWEAMLEDSYSDVDELPPDKEINAAAILDLYEDIVRELRDGSYPPGFRPLLRNIYRELRVGGKPDIIGDVSDLLTRFPDLAGEAMQYVGYTASRDPAKAATEFGELLKVGRFHREQELVQIVHGALVTPPGSLANVADRFADYALNDPHPLVRARALLAWGCHSSPDDFTVADAFWNDSSQTWRIYPFAAIQDKEQAGRDQRYQLWSAEGRFLEQVGQSLIADRLSWRRI